VPSLIIGVMASAGLGAVVHLALMRPLRAVSPLVRVIATLGVLITLQSIARLRYTDSPIVVTSQLPTTVWHIYGTIVISADRVTLLAIALAFAVGLWLFYPNTRFGLGTTAVAENERAAATLGWSPDLAAARGARAHNVRQHSSRDLARGMVTTVSAPALRYSSNRRRQSVTEP
jgi:sulfate-transporting ATPase